jgi:hypothetical protein
VTLRTDTDGWRRRALKAETALREMHRYLYPEDYRDTDPVLDHPHFQPGDTVFEWRGAETMEAVAEMIEDEVRSWH